MNKIQKQIRNKQEQISHEQQKKATYEEAGDAQHVEETLHYIEQLQREIASLHDQKERRASEARGEERHIRDIKRQIPHLKREKEAILSRIDTDQKQLATINRHLEELSIAEQRHR